MSKRKYVFNPELTNCCNYKCIFCPHSWRGKDTPGGNKFDRPLGYMGRDIYGLVLDNAEKYAKSMCLGFFGEPMLHPKFREYVELVPQDREYSFELNTNFSRVTAKDFDVLSLFDSIKISLDASTKKLYDTLCPGNGVLNPDGTKAVDGFAAIEHKLERWLKRKGKPNTRIVHTVSSLNKHDTKSFVRKWQGKLGERDHILTKSVLSYGGVVQDEFMSEYPCKTLDQKWITIAWNGDVGVCNLDVNMELCIGTLEDTRGLGNMLASEQATAVRDRIKKKAGICENCFDANNWSKNKKYFRKDN